MEATDTFEAMTTVDSDVMLCSLGGHAKSSIGLFSARVCVHTTTYRALLTLHSDYGPR